MHNPGVCFIQCVIKTSDSEKSPSNFTKRFNKVFIYNIFATHLNNYRLFKNLFYIFLFLSVFGLRCCTPAFSSCSKQGLLFVAVRGLLTAVSSLVAAHGL